MEDERKLQPGLKGTSRTTVHSGNTAVHMGSGEIEVFATPAMTALMEAAAVRCLQGRLAPGETSVGIRLDISHVAATPVGVGVRAEATLQAVEGRKLVFRVEAFDETEKIGEGTHERAVVNRDRFLSRLAGKKTAIA